MVRVMKGNADLDKNECWKTGTNKLDYARRTVNVIQYLKESTKMQSAGIC